MTVTIEEIEQAAWYFGAEPVPCRLEPLLDLVRRFQPAPAAGPEPDAAPAAVLVAVPEMQPEELPGTLALDSAQEPRQPEAASQKPQKAARKRVPKRVALAAREAAGVKFCNNCNPPREHPLHEFSKDNSSGDGYRYQCRACESSARKAQRVRREQAIAREAQWDAEGAPGARAHAHAHA